jgi:hypothetical protein
VIARGDSDAAMLMWPHLLVQGIKFPTGGVDLTLAGRYEYQGRVGVVFSPLDLYKGLGVKEAAAADCEQHDAQASIEALLASVDDAGKLPALMKAQAFLDAHRLEWQSLTRKEAERFAARVISLTELEDVHARTLVLDRKRVEVQSELARVKARGTTRPTQSLAALERTYLARANAHEQTIAHVRSISPWQLKVTGGIVPTYVPSDWFGVVELSFNLGAFSASHGDDVYLRARSEELRNARYELASRLRDFKKQLAAVREGALRELEVLEQHAGLLGSTRSTLEGSEAEGSAHAAAVLRLEEISLTADATYLRALIDELSAILAQA